MARTPQVTSHRSGRPYSPRRASKTWSPRPYFAPFVADRGARSSPPMRRCSTGLLSAKRPSSPIAGVAAREAGKSVHLIGVEADEGHVAFAREACAINGFAASQVTLFHGVAAADSGTALFPRQERAGEQWGLEPLADVSESEKAEA